MEVIPATADEIAVFKMAAANAYQRAGVPPKVAEQLFNRTLSKLGTDMGLAERKPLTKKASAIADKIAESFGRKRK